MPHLKEKGAVAEGAASFDTLAAANAQRFVYGVFVIWMLDEPALDRACGAKLILRSGVEGVWLRLEVAGAELAVSTHGEIVHAFDR